MSTDDPRPDEVRTDVTLHAPAAEAILRAASEVAGVELSNPADLGGSLRSTVLRCRTAESVHRRANLARLWAGYGRGTPSWEEDPWLARTTAGLLTLLPEAGIAAPPELAGELARIEAVSEDDYPAFTPGDTCPDNNLLTPDGLRLLDFESACFQSVFLTAAYCRMPFSTCWCVYNLPSEPAEEIEQAYREEVVVAYPALADDTVWRAGIRQAIAAWTVSTTVWVLPRVAEEDRPIHRTRRPVPTMRQVLRHRWEMASTLEEFPAFAETMRLMLSKVAGAWDVPPLPGYPAFGG
ncbi:hypothetical protein FHR32_001602 [Streptosporangium album]|uniref:Aminoglycoside phosphotransferase n=1 Tax=Streptosporangium album TaxID=47479 RepID=A0A7W7RSY2_9ACTN|nr:hypothetical protein [Streptosporangium album]MBB4937297.1 hypothetical protein [Streptosporangium album]